MTLYLSLTMSSQVRQNDKVLSVNLLLIFLFLAGVRSESTSLADDEESLLANFSLPEELGETLRGLLTDDNFGELSDAEEELLDDEVHEHEEEPDDGFPLTPGTETESNWSSVSPCYRRSKETVRALLLSDGKGS